MKNSILLYALLISFYGLAQHDHSMHEMQDTTMPVPTMSSAFSLNLPMNRNGSGTGWLTDSTPMYGYMFHTRRWMFMGHGNLFMRYTSQDVFHNGSRGDAKADAVNWFMFMGQRTIRKQGLFRFSSMVSLDNLFGGNGYPLLFQTGETWKNNPLVDRQHPHDLFSELSVSYAYAINKKTDVFIYAGYPGEPALGSVAFMHRVSSLYNPDAPLSHHWNDGTHITFGVLTGGIRLDKFKLDASVFTGREPDENRYDFDAPHFNSYSGRITCNPGPNWSLQASQGFIRSPEITHPDEDVYRTTASVVYSKPLPHDHFLFVTALWGLNHSSVNEHAILLEMVWNINRFSSYGRYEFVQKSSEELDLDEHSYGHNVLFPVHALTLGLGYDLIKSKAGRITLGAQATSYLVDQRLHTLYGAYPLSAQVYLRFYPPPM
jgi:hypothetical protein